MILRMVLGFLMLHVTVFKQKKKKTGTKTLKNDRGIGKRLKMRVTAREEKVHPNIKSPLLLDYLMLMIRTVLYVLQIFL